MCITLSLSLSLLPLSLSVFHSPTAGIIIIIVQIIMRNFRIFFFFFFRGFCPFCFISFIFHIFRRMFCSNMSWLLKDHENYAQVREGRGGRGRGLKRKGRGLFYYKDPMWSFFCPVCFSFYSFFFFLKRGEEVEEEGGEARLHLRPPSLPSPTPPPPPPPPPPLWSIQTDLHRHAVYFL